MNTRARDFMLANHALSGGPKVAAAMGELLAERDRLRAIVDAAISAVTLHRAWRDAPADDITPLLRARAVALNALASAVDQLDVSPTIGGMTPTEAYEFYADPVNQEPQGPPVRRRGNGTPAMGIPERERIVHEDQELRASLERGMGQAAAGEVEGRGDFTRYVAVDPTSPTYDPDQYGTPAMGGRGPDVATMVGQPADVDGADDHGAGDGVGGGLPGIAGPEITAAMGRCACGHGYDDHTSGVAIGCDAMDDDGMVCSCTAYRTPDTGETER